MVKILFGLFVKNSNKELRKTTVILFSPQNSIIVAIIIILKQ
jgi:hypothetical protein